MVIQTVVQAMVNTFKKNNNGFTLVEMIVSLALLGILLTAALRVLGVNLRIYNRMRVSENAGVVADYVLASIENELSNVTAGSEGHRLDILLGDAYKNSVNHGEGIQYYDNDGRRSAIYVSDGEIVFHKYANDNAYNQELEDYDLVNEKGIPIVTSPVTNAEESRLPKENYKGFSVTSIECGTSMYYRMFSSSFTVTVNLYNEIYDYSYSKGMSIDSFNGAFIRGPYVLLGNLADSDIKEHFTID